jgi:hypothetical protein
MAISTNSIIHYTDTFTKIKSILKEGFAIKYCIESLYLDEDKGSAAAHPMISFCDIPLSNSYKHFDAYGNYGIGLTKDWAKKNGVNPVLYMNGDSRISKILYQLIVERRDKHSNLNKEQKANIILIKGFAKNYSGPLKRKKINTPDYRFYDEREWRLVPESIEINNEPLSVSMKFYEADKKKYNNAISKVRFKFEPNDISYIIVNKTSEIPQIINLLRDIYKTKCNAQELDILFSKICSTEQILNDY